MPEYVSAVKKEPRISYSVFTAVPRTAARKQFCIVRDSPDPQEPPQKLKLPGGGVGFRETPREAAENEIFEETGMRIMTPSQVLLVVHKPSLHEQRSDAHHTIFFESDPPIVDVLRRGRGMSEVSWMGVEEIEERIAYDEFHQNHAAALYWYLKRAEYLKERDDRILAPITRRPGLRQWWMVAGGAALVFCFDASCQMHMR